MDELRIRTERTPASPEIMADEALERLRRIPESERASYRISNLLFNVVSDAGVRGGSEKSDAVDNLKTALAERVARALLSRATDPGHDDRAEAEEVVEQMGIWEDEMKADLAVRAITIRGVLLRDADKAMRERIMRTMFPGPYDEEKATRRHNEPGPELRRWDGD